MLASTTLSLFALFLSTLAAPTFNKAPAVEKRALVTVTNQYLQTVYVYGDTPNTYQQSRKATSTSAGPSTTSSSASSSTAAASTSLACPAADGTLYVASSGETFTIECAIDHYQGDLSNTTTSTLDACINTCSSTSGCLAVSWIAGSTETCYLHSTLMPGVANAAVWGAKLSNATVTATVAPSSTSSSAVLSSTVVVKVAITTSTTSALVSSSAVSSTIKTSTSTSTAISSSSSSTSTSTKTSSSSFTSSSTKTSSSSSTFSTVVTSSPSPSSSSVSKASSTTSAKATSSGLPFTQIVAFGDNLSDNGNGSYAHGVSGNPATIYGYGTWTDGPIAVSYLSTMLAAPLTADYAYGHANGGSLFGATIDNTYTQSTANAPDAFAQVANYTSTGNLANVASTLFFLWTGNNDINLYHINVDSTANTGFAKDMSSRMVKLVQNLVNAGAMHIMVPALYPKHISPSSVFYTSTATQVSNLGLAISQANTAISSALASSFPAGSGKPKVVFYDAFTYMVNVWNNAAANGFTMANEFCDGYSDAAWDLCVTQGKGSEFYWMQYLDMTTYVHKMVAADMASAVKAAYA